MSSEARPVRADHGGMNMSVKMTNRVLGVKRVQNVNRIGIHGLVGVSKLMRKLVNKRSKIMLQTSLTNNTSTRALFCSVNDASSLMPQ